MKKILTLLPLLLLITMVGYSQTNASLDYVKIDYDAAGNRFKRSIIVQNDPEIVATVNDNKLNSEKENILKMYPNPVLDQLTVELNSEENQFIELNIIDINGKQIKTFNIQNGKSNLQLHDLALGEYIVYAIVNSEKKSWKITKIEN